MTSPSDHYDFVDEIRVLERAIDIVDHPIPPDMREDSTTVICIQFVRHGLVFILAMAKEASLRPERLQTNQTVASEVWACLEPFISTLDVMYTVYDAERSMAN